MKEDTMMLGCGGILLLLMVLITIIYLSSIIALIWVVIDQLPVVVQGWLG